MSEQPINSPARNSDLQQAAEQGGIWNFNFVRLVQSLTDAQANFAELYTRVQQLEGSCPGYRIDGAGSAAFTGYAPLVGNSLMPATGTLGLAGANPNRSP